MPAYIQNDSSQTTDSSAFPVSTDTLTNPVSVEAKQDSAKISEKKDSTFSKVEIKLFPKEKTTDSIFLKNIQVSETDSSKAEIQDSSVFADTVPIVQQQENTIVSVSQPAKTEENIFPQKLREEQNSAWMLFLFLLIFSLLAWAKVVYSKRLKQMFEAFLSNRYIRQLVREEFVFSHPSSIVLNVVFLFSSSMLLAESNNYFNWNIFQGSAIIVFFKFLFSLTVFYVAKIFLIRASGILFSIGEEITEYVFNIFLFNNILGLLLLPLVMGVLYANAISPHTIILISGALILSAFLFRIAKSFFIGISSTKFSWSYIILYICTLEILPVIVVVKTFFGNI